MKQMLCFFSITGCVYKDLAVFLDGMGALESMESRGHLESLVETGSKEKKETVCEKALRSLGRPTSNSVHGAH